MNRTLRTCRSAHTSYALEGVLLVLWGTPFFLSVVWGQPSPDKSIDRIVPGVAEAVLVEGRWLRLEQALLKHDSEAGRAALMAFSVGDPQNAASFVVNLIEDELDEEMIGQYLATNFTEGSPWPAKLRRLLADLRSHSTEERPIFTDLGRRSALVFLEQDGNDARQSKGRERPEIDLVTRCRLEHQIRDWSARTAAKSTRHPVDPLLPFEFGFRDYRSWEDQVFMNAKINLLLHDLGSPVAAFFHIVPRPHQSTPLTVYSLVVAEYREVVPRKPIWSIPTSHVSPVAHVFEVDGPAPKGLRGMTESIGGGVSFVFRDGIRQDCARVRHPWPERPANLEESRFPFWRLKEHLHAQVRQMYAGDEHSLERDSFKLTAVHEAAHQALHELAGMYVHGSCQYEVQSSAGNMILEISEILADLSVVSEIVHTRDARLALLAAFYSLLHDENAEPRSGRLLASPYHWSAALILRSTRPVDGRLEVDFDQAHTFMHAMEHSLAVAFQFCTVQTVVVQISSFLVDSGRIPPSDSFEMSFDHQRAYIADRARDIRARHPRGSELDAKATAVAGVIHDMVVERRDLAQAMIAELTVMTPALHVTLAEKLGASQADLEDFESFLTRRVLPE